MLPHAPDRLKYRLLPSPPQPPNSATITVTTAADIAAAEERLLSDSRVALVATGRAIGAAIHVAEALRTARPHLAQVTTLRSVDVVDSYELRDGGGGTLDVARRVSGVDILLAPADKVGGEEGVGGYEGPRS